MLNHKDKFDDDKFHFVKIYQGPLPKKRTFHVNLFILVTENMMFRD